MDLKQLFSPSSGCPSRTFEFQRLALIGPLPPSVLFHLAISFVQKRKPAIDSEPTSEKPHVLLLCSNRRQLHEALVSENDEWLAMHGGDPAVVNALENNLEARYMDTSAKWLFFCSALGGDSKERSVMLKRMPDLVIASGISALLQDKRIEYAGIEGYSSLISATIAAFPPSTRIVFIDSPSPMLSQIPLLPSDLHGNLRRQRKTDDANGKQGEVYTVEPRRMQIEGILDYFCDTVGVISEQGGTADASLEWFEVNISRSARAKEGAGEVLATARYALKHGEDESGYSGRERFTVVFE